MPGTSTPLSANGIRSALRKFGVKFNEIPGWETRNRGLRGNGWGPVNGFVVHHTGDDAPDDADERVVCNGRSDLPGPLAQFGLRDDGTVDLIGLGRANHAGSGDSTVYAAVRDETYVNYPPKPTKNDYDGNGVFYGVETYYSGSHKPVQYDAMVNLCAAICDAHGWTAKSVIGHKEWTNQKVDPGSVDMAQFRSDVNARMKAVNTVKPAPAPTPATPAPGGNIMADINSVAAQLAEVQKDMLTKADGGTLRNDLAWQNKQAEALRQTVAAIAADVTAIKAKVGL